MDKKYLYTDASVDVIHELEIDVEDFIDTVIKKYGDEYDRANLELYVVESVMTRFAYYRIKTMVENRKNKEEV